MINKLDVFVSACLLLFVVVLVMSMANSMSIRCYSEQTIPAKNYLATDMVIIKPVPCE